MYQIPIKKKSPEKLKLNLPVAQKPISQRSALNIEGNIGKEQGMGEKEFVVGEKNEVKTTGEMVQSVDDKEHVVLGETNDAFMEELKTSLILKTVNDEDLEFVKSID